MKRHLNFGQVNDTACHRRVSRAANDPACNVCLLVCSLQLYVSKVYLLVNHFKDVVEKYL